VAAKLCAEMNDNFFFALLKVSNLKQRAFAGRIQRYPQLAQAVINGMD
jgi:hypothetical protein